MFSVLAERRGGAPVRAAHPADSLRRVVKLPRGRKDAAERAGSRVQPTEGMCTAGGEGVGEVVVVVGGAVSVWLR